MNAKLRTKEKLISWRGLMVDSEPKVRRVVMSLLALLAISMVATQTNYFVISDAHLMAGLAPITASALLLGPKAGLIVGGLTGAAEWLHATVLPLDVYEQYFSSPINSLLLLAFIGFIMGILYAGASRREYDKQWKIWAALIFACAIGSALFTALFSTSANIINSLINLEIPQSIVTDLTGNKELFSQILANFGLMTMMVVGVALLWNKNYQTRDARTLRQRFQAWLFAVIAAAYLLTATGTYTAVSIVCRSSAENEMQSQLDYLALQLKERDRLFEGIQRRVNLSEARLEELHESTISSVATGLALGEGGICAIAEDGTIVSTNDSSLIGQSFEKVVGSGLASGFDSSIYDANRSVIWYMDGDSLGYIRAAELGYVRITRQGTYQIMTALPQAEVYRWRAFIFISISGVFLALFTAMYIQASILLKHVVVREIDATNEVLGRITEGELNQNVDVGDTVEFARLSAGINATVGSLRDAIAAEAARNERDLATAKAIQESALPRSFPPFPDIQAFDVFASMNAAREVGGDFYDIFLLDEKHIGFLIADVSGKGIPAALFMMAAKTEIANNMQAGMELAIAIQTANWHLCQGNDAGMFVTVWAAVLDWETGEMTYVNAGHNPPLLRRNDGWIWLKERSGLFMGTFENSKYREERITLHVGDELFLYTDGVNEAFNIDGEQFGDERLEAFLNDHAHLHPHALIDTMRDELKSWAEGAEQSDDITMLVLEYGVPPEASGSIELDAELSNLDAAIALVHNELAMRRCPITVQDKIDVALEELFVNVCNYAYPDQEKPGKVQVSYVYNANPNSIVISITDWGIAFDPLSHTDPTPPSSPSELKIGGLGILMAKQLTDDLSYLRDDTANVVVFRKIW